MNEVLQHAFSLVCGQYPGHVWMVDDGAMPCCQRCVGLYVGAALALLLHLFLKPQPTRAFCWLHGLFLVLMVPFGFHWLPQGPVLRCETGILFGFGVVAWLWLAPGARRYGVSTGLHHVNPGYATGVLAAMVFVPGLALGGGRMGAVILSWLAGLGLVMLMGLVLVNLGWGLVAVARRSRVAGARALA